MRYAKKSLGQNFLIDKNIIDKIINLTNIENRDIVEIGPGKGALTEEILKKKPKSLTLIEKDINLVKDLKIKFSEDKKIKIFNKDILDFDLEGLVKNKAIIEMVGVNAMSISDITNIPRPTVVRKLNYLKKNKYISVNKKKLYNLDLEDKALKDTIKTQEKNILSLSSLFNKILNLININ